MRLLQIVHTLSAADGGPARHAMEVNFALNAHGADVQMLVVNSSSDTIEAAYLARPDRPGVAPVTVAGRTFRDRLGVARRAARGSSTWIIHGYYLPWIPIAVLVARMTGRSVLVMPHGSLTSYDRGRRQARKRVFDAAFGWWVNRTVRFVVATQREADELPATAKRVTVVGAGASYAPARIEARRDAGDPVRLLSMSRLTAKKRVDQCIRTLDALRTAGVHSRLIVAGSGEEHEVRRLKDLASEVGVLDGVEFVGQVEGEERGRLYERSDVFLLLSEDENFGIGLADALMSGLPAVTTRAVAAAAGAPANAVVLLDEPDPVAAAEGVRSILGYYPEARVTARSWAESTFLWSTVALRWMDAVAASSKSVGR